VTYRFPAIVLFAVTVASAVASAETDLPRQLEGVQQDDRRGVQLDLDLVFTDEDGHDHRLGDYLSSGKPMLLTLNYLMCQMLCTETLNGLLEGLRGLDWTPGKEFQLVTVSIDPREKPDLAFEKRRAYLTELGCDDATWHFLTGTQAATEALAAQVGFNFRYDRETDQFAHPPTILFISPDGKVMQYLFGKVFKPRDLKYALMDASEGKVGSTFDQLIWSCFHYDELTGKYTPFAFGIMRLGGAGTAITLGTVLFILWRRERARTLLGLTPHPSPGEQLS